MNRLIDILDLPPFWTLAHIGLATLQASVWSLRFPGQWFAGLVLIFAGLALALVAAIYLVRARTAVMPRNEPAELVTRGPFRLSRNPIYLADLIILVGWCLLIGQPLAAILVVPLYLVLDRRFALPEELGLEAKFGDAFKDYARRVPRWL